VQRRLSHYIMPTTNGRRYKVTQQPNNSGLKVSNTMMLSALMNVQHRTSLRSTSYA